MSYKKGYPSNYDDMNDSSSDEDITQKDMEKIQTLWRDVKDVIIGG